MYVCALKQKSQCYISISFCVIEEMTTNGLCRSIQSAGVFKHFNTRRIQIGVRCALVSLPHTYSYESEE